MFGEYLNLTSSSYLFPNQSECHRNIDKDLAFVLPLLADRAAMIKVQIFVLRKDTADIIGRRI